jgi:hypothetical protein
MDVLEERLHELAEHLGARAPERSPALRERGRRLRRRRRLTRATAATLAGVLVVGAVVLVARESSSTNRIETPATAPTTTTATQLGVDDGHDAVTFHDLDAKTTRTVTLPGKATGDYPYQLVRVGDWLVYPGNGIQSIRTDLSSGPVALGNATTFVPSAREGWVWLVTFPGDGQSAETVQEVQVDGTARDPAAQLPSGMVAQIGITGGLLIGNDTTVVKWDPSTGELGPELFSGSAGFIDAHDDTVAWGLECSRTSTCAALRVLDLATGTQREFDAPAGTSGWIPTYGEGSHDALTASGDFLAVRAGGDVRSGDNHPATSTLSVINLRTGEIHEVPHSTNDNAFSRTAWSPDNRTLFYEATGNTIGAYQPDTATATTYSGECCGVALVTIPATPAKSTTTSTTPTTTTTAVAADITSLQPTFEQQVNQLETWYHDWPAEAPGGRPDLAAEFTYCDYTNNPDAGAAPHIGLTNAAAVQPTFSSYFKLSEPLTEAHLADGCFYRADRFPDGDLHNPPVETPADQLPPYVFCATDQPGPGNLVPGAPRLDALLKPAVVFAGTDCTSAGYEDPPPNFIADLDHRRHVEIEMRAVPKACPTADDASRWATHIAQQELGQTWQVAGAGSTATCFRPHYIDWENHQAKLIQFQP